MNTQKLLPIIGVALILVGGYLFFTNTSGVETVGDTDETATSTATTTDMVATSTATTTGETATESDASELEVTETEEQSDEQAITGADMAAGTQLEGTPMATTTADGQVLIGGDAVAGEMDDDGQASFTVIGTNFSYDIKEMRVKEGDKVTVTFRSNGGNHDWVVDEFDARTEVVSAQDGETSVTFIADRTGNFEYYCSVGSHRALGMVGRLIVE